MITHLSSGLEDTPCLLCGADAALPLLTSQVQLAPGGSAEFSFVTCGRCGLVYMSPRPGEEQLDDFYPPDYLPHRGPAAWGRWSPLVKRALDRMDRRRVRLLLRHAPIAPGDPVLDLGCGRPTFLRALERRTHGLAVGIDTSDRGWSEERTAWQGLHLVRGTLAEEEDTLRAMAGSGFRAITLWHALEHDPRPLATLRTLRSLSRSDGVLVVEVPDLASLTAKLSGPDWAGFHTPRHTAAYAPHTLRALVEEAGWQPIQHLRHGTLDPYVLRWLSVMATRRRRLSGSLEGDFPRFLAGKVAWLPLSLVQRWIPLGVQVVVARVRR